METVIHHFSLISSFLSQTAGKEGEDTDPQGLYLPGLMAEGQVSSPPPLFCFSSFTTQHIFKQSGIVLSELQVCSLLLKLWGHCWIAEISPRNCRIHAGLRSIINLMLGHLLGLVQGEHASTKTSVLWKRRDVFPL